MRKMFSSDFDVEDTKLSESIGSGKILKKTIIYLQTLTVIPALEINLMNDS